MKKVTTDSKQFGALRMLDQFLRSRGLSLSDTTAHGDFVKQLSAALREHRKNPALIHGFRGQTMFAYLAAALGHCKIITEEDSGEFFIISPNLKRPDFRVLMDDGKEFFVEVKNFKQHDPVEPYVLKADYTESLQNYVDAFKKPLLFAIYWVRWQIWTLVPLDCFSKVDRMYSLDIRVQPDKFGVIIPKDFKSDVLGIWRFVLQPTLPTIGVGGVNAA